MDNPVISKDADHLAIFMFLMMTATHKARQTQFNGEVITLQPGQLVTSTQAICDRLGCTESRTKRILKAFETVRLIDRQTTRHGSLITLLCWDSESTSDQPNDQQTSDKRPTNDQQTSSKQECNPVITEEDMSISNEIHRPSGKARQEKDEAVRLWNQLPDPVVKIKGVSAGSKRDRLLTKRLADYGLDEYRKAIENISHSEFLQTGKFFSFDWFIRPENFVKVLEGNYNDKDTRAAPEPSMSGYTDEDYARIAAAQGAIL